MSTRMLIDASHPEETRVAVMKGNKVEEFDFESQSRKQLRGNIYLAKVTRVEPSLQAAFIDYGGNRHGFLAFSEIHPDYYQIPVADRQALLREEAAAARAGDDEDEAPRKSRSRSRSKPDAEEEADEVQAKPRKRRRRRSAKSDEDGADAVEAANDTSEVDAAADGAEPDEAGEDAPKPKRRTSRRTAKKAEQAPEDADASAPDAQSASSDEEDEAPRPPRRRTSRRPKKSDDGSDEPPKTMAAENDGETVSEPAGGEGEEEPPKPKRRRAPRKKAEPAEAAGAEEGATEATDEKPAPKRRRRKSAAETEDEAAAQPVADAEEEAPKPKRRRRKSAKSDDGADEAPAVAATAAGEETSANGEEEKPAPKRRRRTRAKKADDDGAEEAKAAPDDEDGGDESVEDVGTDDAMEEVPERRVSRRNYKIQEVIKRRQIMLVQVVKEERGNKGAALTTYLSLAGRYSVLMPNTARGGGISRKITNAADRKKLKEIANSLEVSEGMGVILRTAGADRTKADIKRDFEYLLRLWENVRQLTLKSTAPCLVYEEGSLIKRSIRDLYDSETKEIVVAGREGYEEARDFMSMLMPDETNRVKFHDAKVPLFVKQGVESQLDQMLEQQVTLKSGGYLVINQTEALVAIDVNSGKSTRQHSIEETAVQTNLEAAEEVARQLRLRDLAGLIVIDFIDMDDRRNNRAVEKRLKEALKNDRARIQVGRISHFGLMEMSRQRIRASVLDTATVTCPHCAGLGFVRSASSVAIQVLRAIEEHLTRSANHNLIVRVRSQTALFLLNQQRASLDDLEDRFGVTLRIEIDEGVSDHVDIEKGDQALRRRREASHVQVDSVELGEAGDDEEAAADASSEEEPKQGSTTEARTDDGDDDSKPRKRRRGRRGGRKRGDGSDADADASTEADDAQPVAKGDGETADGQANADATGAAEGEEAEAPKPKRRRRAKRDDTEKVDAAEASGHSDAVTPDGAEPGSEEAPERPKRASTRRPRKRKDSDEAVPDEAVLQTAIEPNSTAVVGETPGEPIPDPDEPPRPKRRATSRPKRGSAGDDANASGDAEKDGEKKSWLQRTFFS